MAADGQVEQGRLARPLRNDSMQNTMANDLTSGAALSKTPTKDENATNGTEEKQDDSAEGTDGAPPESVFQLHIKLPHEPGATSVMCSTHEYALRSREELAKF